MERIARASALLSLLASIGTGCWGRQRPSSEQSASTGIDGSSIRGRVLGANAPIAHATVAVWAASADAPRKLAETKTDAQGNFGFVDLAGGPNAILYVTALGGQFGTNASNPAIGMLSVLGSRPPHVIVVNEFTTIASVWTNAQFLDGTALRGNELGLRIAAGNVQSFVDVTTGGWGGAIQGPLNSSQTPTMANFATLANLLSGCITRGAADACDPLFVLSTPPGGSVPTNTLVAAEAIARYPWRNTEELFALHDELYPVPTGKQMRAVPFMPYLQYAPSAWVLPLKFDGGGYRAGGKAMFDSRGDLWVGDNFTIGWQASDELWQGNATKFAPNGRPLSPATTGFAGGGMLGGTFGTAIDAKDNAWFTTYSGKSIAVFDRNGRPLTPPEGLTFDGQLGRMQGVIVTESGDVWVLGNSKNQLVYFPHGDLSKGRIVCEGLKDPPCSSFVLPFHLGIDQQDRIWVTNLGSNHVTRFSASDPTQVETFEAGYSGSGLGIDSRGNVWVTNRLGSSSKGKATLEQMVKVGVRGGDPAEVLAKTMSKQVGGPEGGSVTMLRPDGSEAPGSPFTGASLPGPWAATIDGDDNVWISNFAGAQGRIAHLCGARTETCPPGMKTGDPISPPGGYVGGGLQMQTDLAIDPAGNVWVMNNWQDIDACFGTPAEAVSTLCGGQGVTIFFGMAKPVRAPQIGPVRQP